MSKMTRKEISLVLEELVMLLELTGENPFKIKAYRKGAEIVQSFEGNIVERALDHDLEGIPGLGKGLQAALYELVSTGELKLHQTLKGQYPESLFDLFELQGLGVKKIKALHDTLEVSSIDELKAACESGRVSELSGFGKKTVENILQAISSRQQYAGYHRYMSIAGVAQLFLERLQEHPEVHQSTICGSFRRGKEVSHDLDFLVATGKPGDLTKFFTTFPEVERVIACGETKASVILQGKGLQCDLRAVSNAQFPFAQQYFTGSKEHNVAVRSKAKKYGLSLNEYGFTRIDETNEPLPEVHTEADLYRGLGLDFIEPELRENRGEIEMAETGALPKLVELTNLRGTFHNHTTASDGRHTLREMADEADALGLQYLGIADHSKSSFQANGLSEERLLAQIADIRELNEQFANEGRKFRVFAGSEVDILKSGALDYDDELLKQLDYTVISVHQPLNMSEDQMTARLIKAMESPYATMLGHVTGRLLLRRDPYPVNLEKVIDCAAETGTIIELNCSSMRADMDWRWWRLAQSKGVKTSINPDAHSIEGLQNLAFGVKLARKGGLTKGDVINCLSLDEINNALQVKRP